MRRFATWSNAVYLLMPLGFLPLEDLDFVLTASSMFLCFGSGYFHLEMKRNGIGHQLDELAMMSFLVSFMAVSFAAASWPVWIPISVLALVPLAAMYLDRLSSFLYVPLLLIPTTVALLYVLPWYGVVWPMFGLIAAVLIRGHEDHSVRHGLWHLIVALMIILIGVQL